MTISKLQMTKLFDDNDNDPEDDDDDTDGDDNEKPLNNRENGACVRILLRCRFPPRDIAGPADSGKSACVDT